MKIEELHGWQVSPKEAIEIQNKLAVNVNKVNHVKMLNYIAGADISFRKSLATAAIVVLKYPEMTLIESQIIQDKPCFPYVPGLLSFREIPLILKLCQKLKMEFDLMLVDGQGIAHPRRFGLASHLGLLIDKPTIGCAKSRLIGEYTDPVTIAGNWTELTDAGEVIGAVLRTRENVRPVYVSIGNKIDLSSSIYWVLACCKGYRIPEPLRLAHLAAGGILSKVEL